MNSLTKDMLDMALPNILCAPKDKAAVEKLCFRPDFGLREFTKQLTLTAENGVIGDRWQQHGWLRLPSGAPDRRIQISLLPKRVFQLLTCLDTFIHPGDTMIVDMDMSEENLPSGCYLQLGSAILQVSDVFNTGCEKWSKRYGKESLIWINIPENKPKRLRGIFLQIIRDGIVHEHDLLTKIESNHIDFED